MFFFIDVTNNGNERVIMKCSGATLIPNPHPNHSHNSQSVTPLWLYVGNFLHRLGVSEKVLGGIPVGFEPQMNSWCPLVWSFDVIQEESVDMKCCCFFVSSTARG